MTRRQLLALAALSLPVACKRAAPQAAPAPGKKGLGLSTKKRSLERVRSFLEKSGSRWVYNWTIQPLENLPSGVEFIPMIYNARKDLGENISRVKSHAPALGYSALLGFNEPDAKTQGNTTVEEALDAWPMLEATGLRLGSPATVHPENEWMTAFMKGAQERGLRVDFVCMHSYGGPSVTSLLRKIEEVHALYQRPIWITEFAVADWDAKTPAENRFKPERIAEFVSELLPKLEAMDIIERYAWFHGGVSGGPIATSKLFNPDGSLTVVGEAYRAVG